MERRITITFEDLAGRLAWGLKRAVWRLPAAARTGHVKLDLDDCRAIVDLQVRELQSTGIVEMWTELLPLHSSAKHFKSQVRTDVQPHCRTARKSDTRLLPSLLRVTPSAVSEHFSLDDEDARRHAPAVPVQARPRRQPATAARDLSRLHGAGGLERPRRRARARHGALGHADAASIPEGAGRPWRYEHPQRRLGSLATARKGMRGSSRSLLAACLLVLTLPAQAADAPHIAFFGFSLINTSLEQTKPEEEARLKMLDDLLERKLDASGRFKIVPIPADVRQALAGGPAIQNCNGCERDAALKSGGDLAAWGRSRRSATSSSTSTSI
jgi:Protein of unknown function (DUF2380)